MADVRILLAAGGTGGHVYPAIAIATAIQEKNKNAQILFVGTKKHMEWEAVPKAGFKITNIWISGFQRRFTLKNILFPLKLIVSFFQSIAILNKFKPNVIISCGGYVAGPIGWVAAKMGVKIIIQEQNSFPGVTNRLLAKYAEKIYVAFEEAKDYFPNKTVINAGNPTRNTLKKISKKEGLYAFNFNSLSPVVLIIGGSLGAKSINEAVALNLRGLSSIQIIWQCGSRYYEKLKKEIEPEKYPNILLMPFIHNMEQAYAAADLVISRAGASTCSELMLIGKPSLLIPSPNVAGDHQTKNAKSMAENGAAILLEDHQAMSKLPTVVHTLIHNRAKLESMGMSALKMAKPYAANQIANDALELINPQPSN